MDKQHTLSVVIREALSERGVTSLRAAANATGIDKDAIARRYRGDTDWTWPDLDMVTTFLGIQISELTARAEKRAA